MIETSLTFHQDYPGACCGFLAVRNVTNPPTHPELEQHKLALQQELRQSYPDTASLKSDPVLQAYAAYYKRFKKNYHVFFQLESVTQKDRPIPSVAGLVECMFMAELKNRLLTAGHDLDTLSLPVTVAVAGGSETYTLLRGVEQELKPGDLCMYDAQGVISSIIYGPDQRTQITAVTRSALFAIYAPPGIGPGRVEQHLETILTYVKLVSPDASVELDRVITA